MANSGVPTLGIDHSVNLRGSALTADLVIGVWLRHDELAHSGHPSVRFGNKDVYIGNVASDDLAEVCAHEIWFGYTVSHGVELGVPATVLAPEFDESLEVGLRGWPHGDIHVRMFAFRWPLINCWRDRADRG